MANCTKKERNEVLKELGKTENEMQSYWDEIAEMDFPNNKIRLLKNSGRNWTDLTPSQMRQLPTLKQGYLDRLAERKKAEDEAERLRLEKEKADIYYNEHFDEIMVQKIDSHEELSERELKRLVFSSNVVDVSKGENTRWSRSVTSIVELCNRFFAIVWEEGLTECQENSFYDQPYEVKLHEYEKTITVKEWKAL